MERGRGERSIAMYMIIASLASHLPMTVTVVGEEEEVTGPSGAGVSTIP